MDLENRPVVVCLTEAGFQDLNFLVGTKEDREGIGGWIRGTDQFGIWMSVVGGTWQSFLIIPWHYIRAIELPMETEAPVEVRRVVGFKP
jgi:hypothetical protein